MALDWTPHPILKIPDAKEQLSLGAEKVLKYWTIREEAIARELDDPFNHGTEFDHWKVADEQLRDHAELLTLGGNRSGKTEWASKRVVQSLCANPGSIIWCFTATSQNSIAHQQASVYKYLPNEYKTLGRSRTYYVSFSQKNGFTSSSFILPNRSMCVFRNWSQNIETIEGGEIGSPQDPIDGTHNIGCWFDEEVPLNFLSTVRYRTLTRADSRGIPARIISTFTTVSGWSPTVASYLSGAMTLDEVDAELLPGEKVPVLQQPVKKSSRVIYFHTANNPYGGWEAMKNQLSGTRRDEILCRAYGVPVKPSNTTFKNLTSKVIKRHDEIPIIQDPANNPCNWILSVDPAGSKSWFMLLVGVAPNGVHYVVKEWPDPSYGEWADLERGDKGRPGEASLPNGFGIKDYAGVIRKLLSDISEEEFVGVKDNVDIIMDPRLGSATYAKAEGTSNIIEDLQEEGINVYPAEALPIEDGLQAINTLLSYDASKPIDFTNHSKLIFSDQCGNTLFCCQNYNVEDGLKAVTKDPVDCLRYVAVGNYQYLDDMSMKPTDPGGY